MILKAGTYRFNNVLNITQAIAPNYSEIDNAYEGSYDFIFSAVINDTPYDFTGVHFYYEDEFKVLNYVMGEEAIPFYTGENGWQFTQEHTIPTDQEVDNTFGTWYIANTNYNEVNTPSYLAEITYNGETIAQLNAGETCTLKCAGLPMATDIIVKINEVN